MNLTLFTKKCNKLFLPPNSRSDFYFYTLCSKGYDFQNQFQNFIQVPVSGTYMILMICNKSIEYWHFTQNVRRSSYAIRWTAKNNTALNPYPEICVLLLHLVKLATNSAYCPWSRARCNRVRDSCPFFNGINPRLFYVSWIPVWTNYGCICDVYWHVLDNQFFCIRWSVVLGFSLRDFLIFDQLSADPSHLKRKLLYEHPWLMINMLNNFKIRNSLSCVGKISTIWNDTLSVILTDAFQITLIN